MMCRSSETSIHAKPVIFIMGMGWGIASPVVGAGVGLVAGGMIQTTREVCNLCRYLIW